MKNTKFKKKECFLNRRYFFSRKDFFSKIIGAREIFSRKGHRFKYYNLWTKESLLGTFLEFFLDFLLDFFRIF